MFVSIKERYDVEALSFLLKRCEVTILVTLLLNFLSFNFRNVFPKILGPAFSQQQCFCLQLSQKKPQLRLFLSSVSFVALQREERLGHRPDLIVLLLSLSDFFAHVAVYFLLHRDVWPIQKPDLIAFSSD